MFLFLCFLSSFTAPVYKLPHKSVSRQTGRGIPQGIWLPAAVSTSQKPHKHRMSSQRCDMAPLAAPASRTPCSKQQDSGYCLEERLQMDKTHKTDKYITGLNLNKLINKIIIKHFDFRVYIHTHTHTHTHTHGGGVKEWMKCICPCFTPSRIALTESAQETVSLPRIGTTIQLFNKNSNFNHFIF